MIGKPSTVLGISPGSRYIGVAVLSGTELRDWRLKVFPGRWSEAKGEKVRLTIEDYFKIYRPDAVAVKRVHPSRGSLYLSEVIKHINGAAKQHGLRPHLFSLEAVKYYLAQGRKINKKLLAEIVAARFPILFHQLHRETSQKNQYYARVFEAVALAITCHDRIDQQPESTSKAN